MHHASKMVRHSGDSGPGHSGPGDFIIKQDTTDAKTLIHCNTSSQRPIFLDQHNTRYRG
jgi:hypothetical protein